MNNDAKKNHILTIPEEHAEERLDQALAKLLPAYSRTQIKEWIDAGTILVNDKPAKAKLRVKGGEIVVIEGTVKPQPQWQAQEIPLSVVYEDEEILLINKPVGLVVHPGTGNAHSTLLNALLHHAPSLQNLPRAGILHRLDKDTSGLLIIAKTPEAYKYLSHQLKKRTITREYQAIVYGNIISGGTIDAPIDRHPIQRKRMGISETGKPARTHYRVMEKYRGFTRLKIRLETGRTHQIRVHMAHIRHPIVGDAIYGARLQQTKRMMPELVQTLRQCKHQVLHAFALGFIHPRSREEMRFEIDLPEDMKKLISALQNDAKWART